MGAGFSHDKKSRGTDPRGMKSSVKRADWSGGALFSKGAAEAFHLHLVRIAQVLLSPLHALTTPSFFVLCICGLKIVFQT